MCERQLEVYVGRPVGVLVRTATELAELLACNPFPDAPPSSTVAIFLPFPPEPEALAGVRYALPSPCSTTSGYSLLEPSPS